MVRSAADHKSGWPDPITDPLVFLEYAHRLGAAGIQAPLGVREPAYVAAFRDRAEAWGMFVEASIQPPRDDDDVDRFEAAARTAREMGARTIRTVLLPGRRYEQFHSLAEFREAEVQGEMALRRALPAAARYGMRLAVENHKDHRVEEKLALLRRVGSEHVGLCVDTGNDISLLQDPMAVVEAYAPWAFSIHLKDMAVEESADGFLLSEVPLGEGILDLPAMLRTLRGHHPEALVTLEMITRDPLPIPCLTEGYWASMPDVPAPVLARALRMVREKAGPRPLPRITGLPVEEQLRVEEENIVRSLAHAAGRLGL